LRKKEGKRKDWTAKKNWGGGWGGQAYLIGEGSRRSSLMDFNRVTQKLEKGYSQDSVAKDAYYNGRRQRGRTRAKKSKKTEMRRRKRRPDNKTCNLGRRRSVTLKEQNGRSPMRDLEAGQKTEGGLEGGPRLRKKNRDESLKQKKKK